MGKTQYHVVPRDDGWAVKKSGSSRASAIRESKTAAVQKAKSLSKNNSPSELFVHRANGTTGEKHTYGSDPFPPRG